MLQVLRHRKGIIHTTRVIVAEEGYEGLWRGNTANLLRIAPFKVPSNLCSGSCLVRFADSICSDGHNAACSSIICAQACSALNGSKACQLSYYNLIETFLMISPRWHAGSQLLLLRPVQEGSDPGRTGRP